MYAVIVAVTVSPAVILVELKANPNANGAMGMASLLVNEGDPGPTTFFAETRKT